MHRIVSCVAGDISLGENVVVNLIPELRDRLPKLKNMDAMVEVTTAPVRLVVTSSLRNLQFEDFRRRSSNPT